MHGGVRVENEVLQSCLMTQVACIFCNDLKLIFQKDWAVAVDLQLVGIFYLWKPYEGMEARWQASLQVWVYRSVRN